MNVLALHGLHVVVPALDATRGAEALVSRAAAERWAALAAGAVVDPQRPVGFAAVCVRISRRRYYPRRLGRRLRAVKRGSATSGRASASSRLAVQWGHFVALGSAIDAMQTRTSVMADSARGVRGKRRLASPLCVPGTVSGRPIDLDPAESAHRHVEGNIMRTPVAVQWQARIATPPTSSTIC